MWNTLTHSWSRKFWQLCNNVMIKKCISREAFDENMNWLITKHPRALNLPGTGSVISYWVMDSVDNF